MNVKFEEAERVPVKDINVWPRDPLHYHVEFSFHARHYPLGYPLEISTNSSEVIRAAEQSWGVFPHLYSARPVHIRVGVVESGSKGLPLPPVYRAQHNLITIVSDAENFATCDVTSGFAFCWVSSSTIENLDFFRYHFLDLIVGVLVAPQHFAIVHSACVALDDRGVLLCGHSGAGKSTLAFACARRGWTFISDDAAYVQRRNPQPVVLGNPLSFRLRENSADLFPELGQHPIIRRQNGEMGFEVATANLPDCLTAFQCHIDFFIFLDRRYTGPARLNEIPTNEAFRRLDGFLDYTLAYADPFLNGSDPQRILYDPKAREEQRAALRKLLVGGTYELQYSTCEAAVQQLVALIRGDKTAPRTPKGNAEYRNAKL